MRRCATPSMNRRCIATNSWSRHDRRKRAASREQADAQQGTLGTRGTLPHRKYLAPRSPAPAARTAPDEGLADARSRTDAEHLARALAARRLRRGRTSDLLEFYAVHGAAADKIPVRHPLRHHVVALRQSMGGARNARPFDGLPATRRGTFRSAALP